MQVMQVMAGARHGGAEAFFNRLVVALHRAGLDQHVVMRRDADRAALLQAAGLTPTQLRFGGALDLLTPWRIRQEIHRYRPNVVLSWMSRAARMCPRGTADYVHCARLGGYYDLKYYRTCDHLIGNTRDIVDYLVREGWPAERAHYLPNFVDAATLPALPRAELNTPADAPLLVALGRLHRNKAFDVLLDAVAQLPGTYLWLAGEGPLKEQLQQQARLRGIEARVRFLGWRSDTPALYAAADIVVCPSRVEPLGNVVIEAWAQHRPIVAAMAAGPLQLIQDGENGALVPLEDTVTLAQSIQQLIDNPDGATQLAEAGYDTYRREFTEAAVVARYMNFFKQVAP
jgi:glycosyltransferase involved in cell wall biosynthesis